MKRALVVDDDEQIRSVVQAIMELEGFEVITAIDGKNACQILTEPKMAASFNIMILDVMMPHMNGHQVLDKLRKDEHIPNIPVLMLTAEDKSDDILKGYEKGADYYVTKPFTRQQLIYGLKIVLA